MRVLAELANELKIRGLYSEADVVDRLIVQAAVWDRFSRFIKDKYEKLRRSFERKKFHTDDAAGAHREEAGKRLDDVLRQRQLGHPGQKLYSWFCRQNRESCPVCLARHGRIRTMDQWQMEGMPGLGVCQKGNKCACILIEIGPSGMVGQVADDQDIAAGTIGLREDGTLENMNQGFVLEPFFSNYGDIQ